MLEMQPLMNSWPGDRTLTTDAPSIGPRVAGVQIHRHAPFLAADSQIVTFRK